MRVPQKPNRLDYPNLVDYVAAFKKWNAARLTVAKNIGVKLTEKK